MKVLIHLTVGDIAPAKLLGGLVLPPKSMMDLKTSSPSNCLSARVASFSKDAQIPNELSTTRRLERGRHLFSRSVGSSTRRANSHLREASVQRLLRNSTIPLTGTRRERKCPATQHLQAAPLKPLRIPSIEFGVVRLQGERDTLCRSKEASSIST